MSSSQIHVLLTNNDANMSLGSGTFDVFFSVTLKNFFIEKLFLLLSKTIAVCY